MKTWQETTVDLTIIIAASALAIAKIISVEIWLLVIGPITGAAISAKAKGNGGNGSGKGIAAGGSVVLMLLAGAYEIATTRGKV